MKKNWIKLQQHSGTFEEAKTIFYDDNALLIDDIDQLLVEDRFITSGMSKELRILVVYHCYRD